MKKHKHHIIPKHAGGTDDPNNLIELTVEEHAEAHKKLWEQYGKKQDYLAWQGLAGLKGKTELAIEASRAAWKGQRQDKETVELIRKCAIEQWAREDDPRKTIEHREKVSKQQKIIQNLPEIRKSRADALSKTWEVIDPDGNTKVIKNLQEFCQRNNLISSNMKKVAYGERNHHKNWKCRRAENVNI